MCVNSWDLILWSWLMATAALVAWVVYHFIGLAILRRSWINLDLIWSFSLLVAGISLFLHG